MYRRTVGRAEARGGRAIPRSRRAGFTLIETIVSLAVIAVATGIFVGLFGRSLELGRLAHDRTLAAQAAQTQLDLIARQPKAFLWKVSADKANAQFPILSSADDPKAGVLITVPSAMPADEAADRRAEASFDAFRWRAFGRQAKDGTYYEVTVAVTWKEAGKDNVVAVTSAVPSASVEASS